MPEETEEWPGDEAFSPDEGAGPRRFTPKKATFVVADPDLPRFEEQSKERVVGSTMVNKPTEETPRFEHACCKAVRPNPDDPSIDGAVREPYLEYATPVRPTATFGLYVGLAGFLAVLTFVLAWFDRSPWMERTAAGVAGAILLFLGVSYFSTKGALERIQIEAVRHIEDDKIDRGTLFHATLDTSGSMIPGGLQVTITDQKSGALRPVEPPSIEGVGQVRYKVRPQARGHVTFKGLDVRARSRTGLWVQDRDYRFRTTIEVGPSTAAISWNAVLSGYVPFDLGAPASLKQLYREVENEEQRDYLPGDRMKDVDWRRYAMTGQMTIRRRWVEPETTIVFMFDMGRSMLLDQAGYRNIDLAAEVAQEMMQWGLSRNHEVGMVAFNEERILDHVRPTRAKVQMKVLDNHLRHVLDYKLKEEWGEDGEPHVLIIGDPENLRMGIQGGLKARNTASCSIILFSDMQTIHEDVVQTLSKACESGMPVIAMFMPPPSLRPYKPDGRRDEDEGELRGDEQARGLRDLLLTRGAEFLEVNPFPEETALFTEDELEQYRQGMIDSDADGDGIPDAVMAEDDSPAANHGRSGNGTNGKAGAPPAPKPGAKAAAKPTAKPAAKPGSKPTAKPATKQATKPAAKR